MTVGSGRVGVGLLGLLELADPVPAVAAAAGRDYVVNVERQAVRGVAVPWDSTRRPIVAVVANGVQVTSVVGTQGGQVEVITCIGGGREASVPDTMAVVGVVLVCCTQVGCTVGRFLGVVITICL